MRAIPELRATKEMPASRPNPQGEWGLRPISLSGLVEDSWYRLPRPSSISTRKTHSPLLRYFLNDGLGLRRLNRIALVEDPNQFRGQVQCRVEVSLQLIEEQDRVV